MVDRWRRNWCTPSATTLVPPLSAVNAKRIPRTDAVIVIWNNAAPGRSKNFGDTDSLWRPRSPLVYAISEDNCQTWSHPVIIDRGTAAYPSICFSDGDVRRLLGRPRPQSHVPNPKSHLKLVAYDISTLHLK